jgi:cell filamentation protein
MHRVSLGDIYVSAGEYRQVNMAEGSFMFAAANQVPKLMHEFGREALRNYTPCRFEDEGELAKGNAAQWAFTRRCDQQINRIVLVTVGSAVN